MTRIKCPTCGRSIAYQHDNPFRPFCSERCRLIDLGEWASGDRRIAGESIDPEHIEQFKDKH